MTVLVENRVAMPCAGSAIRRAVCRASRRDFPFRHWLLRDVLPRSLSLSTASLELSPPEIDDTRGKRETHNASRIFLNDANLRSARLDGATMDSVSVVNTRFDNAILYRASMADNDQRNAVFQGADLRLRDWSRTVCPDGIRVGGSHPTCCNNLNGSTAKFCGRS